MKRLAILILFLAAIYGGASAQTDAQGKKRPADACTAVIAIPSYCCKGLNATIENTLAYEKGVISWELHPEKKNVAVVYRSKKTNPEKIEKALSENGVRTEHFAANPRAIKDLPKCCQPAARGGEADCGQ